jgi:hypothetical protein
MPSATDTTVKIYVRLGTDSNERVVSFRIPEGLDPLELLDLGLTLDGNQAAFAVSRVGSDPEKVWYQSPLVESLNRSLTGALGDAQRELVKYLREKGFTPQFA